MAPNWLARPTPMLRKQIGQMRKLLGFWGKKKVNQPPLILRGAPQLLMNSHGSNTKHLVRRQTVLNRHFSEVISDVIANQEIERQLSDMDVKITSIETKAFNKGIDIFYATSRKDLDNVSKELCEFLPRICKTMTDMQLVGRLPRINFIFDSANQLNDIINNLLSIADKGSYLSGANERALLIRKRDIKNEIKNGTSDGNNIDDDKEHMYKFSCPPDMTNTIFGYDFVPTYQKVLDRMARSRASQSRQFQAVSDPLPPAEWTNPIFIKPSMETDPDDDTPDPSTRLNLMKNFIINQRKKTQTLARSTRKLEILQADLVKWEASENIKNNYQTDASEVFGADALNDELVRGD